jgi:hypothetical protein
MSVISRPNSCSECLHGGGSRAEVGGIGKLKLRMLWSPSSRKKNGNSPRILPETGHVLQYRQGPVICWPMKGSPRTCSCIPRPCEHFLLFSFFRSPPPPSSSSCEYCAWEISCLRPPYFGCPRASPGQPPRVHNNYRK